MAGTPCRPTTLRVETRESSGAGGERRVQAVGGEQGRRGGGWRGVAARGAGDRSSPGIRARGLLILRRRTVIRLRDGVHDGLRGERGAHGKRERAHSRRREGAGGGDEGEARGEAGHIELAFRGAEGDNLLLRGWGSVVSGVAVPMVAHQQRSAHASLTAYLSMSACSPAAVIVAVPCGPGLC